jgi:hypothetical protein
MLAHRRRGRAQQKSHVAPINRQMLELQNRARREQTVEILGFELDRRQRHARLDATLQLQKLDLKVNSRGKVRLFLLQPPKLRDFA